MTPASVTTFGLLIIAVLTALVGVMAFIHTQVMPPLSQLCKDFYELRQSNALSAQVNQQNTLRLNGQSAKIDTLLLATPPPLMLVTPPAPPMLVDAPALVDAPVLPADPPARVNVTVSADRPLSAAELAAAHAQLDQIRSLDPALNSAMEAKGM